MALTTKVGNQHDLVLSCLHIQDAAMNYSKIRLDNTMPYRKCREPKQQPSNARSVSPVPWFLSVSRATSFTFCTLVRERNTPWIEVRVHSSTASEEWNYVTREGERRSVGNRWRNWRGLLKSGKLPVLATEEDATGKSRATNGRTDHEHSNAEGERTSRVTIGIFSVISKGPPCLKETKYIAALYGP